MNRKVRVLIVDDSIVACKALADALASDPGMEIAAVAHSGASALTRLPQCAPDAVLLDVDMPGMDGLQVLAEIRKTHPRLPVIMCSGLTGVGSAVTVKALLGGASDYVTKPQASRSGAAETFRRELLDKIRALARPEGPAAAETSAPLSAGTTVTANPADSWSPAPGPRPRIEIVAIGVSTGGPKALAELIPRLPADFPVPIVVVQHMPPPFTRSLAQGLARQSALAVEEGFAGAEVVPGKVWIAPAGFHMVLARRGARVELAVNEEPPELSCRPSANVLFRSAASLYGPSVLALVLTGMGSDGCDGAGAVRKAGGSVFIQDEASSVVWGMPGAVAKAGWQDRIIPLPQMAGIVHGAVLQGRARAAGGEGAHGG